MKKEYYEKNIRYWKTRKKIKNFRIASLKHFPKPIFSTPLSRQHMFFLCGQAYDSFEILPPTSDIKEFRFVLNDYKNNDYFVFYFTPKSEKCRDIQMLINKKYNHLLSRFLGV